MHPQIRARHLDTLRTKQLGCEAPLNEQVDDLKSYLSVIIENIDSIRDADDYDLPQEFADFFSSALRFVREFDHRSKSDALQLQALQYEIAVYGRLLNALLTAQSARSNSVVRDSAMWKPSD